MKRLWRRHPYALSGFVLAATVTLFFLLRLTVQVIYWSDPAHHNLTVQPWMTVGYVARSWGLDARQIDTLAGLPSPQGHPQSLLEIAAQRGVPVAQIIAEVDRAIAMLKAGGVGE